MKLPRRTFVRFATATALFAALTAMLLAATGPYAWAQTRTIRIVVPYPPGSGPDILSRLLSEQIGRTNGPTVVVENRPGGGTLIGTEAVARAAPDGNTVLLVANTFVVTPSLKPRVYEISSFEPVCYLASTPIVLVVQGSSPYKTLGDLIAAARAKPGALSVAGSPASSLQIAYEVFKRAANVDMTYVPFPGTPPAINTLLGGHVTAVSADYPTVVPHLKSVVLRGLVTANAKRVETMPDVPTFAEAGLPKYEAEIFYGIVAPPKTPADQVALLTNWFKPALKAPEVKPKLDQQGLFPVGICGAEFGTYMRNLAEEYSRIIHEANIKSE